MAVTLVRVGDCTRDVDEGDEGGGGGGNVHARYIPFLLIDSGVCFLIDRRKYQVIF